MQILNGIPGLNLKNYNYKFQRHCLPVDCDIYCTHNNNKIDSNLWFDFEEMFVFKDKNNLHLINSACMCTEQFKHIFSLYFSAINGRIDQVNQVLELDREHMGTARYNALDKWTSQLHSVHMSVVNKTAWSMFNSEHLYLCVKWINLYIIWINYQQNSDSSAKYINLRMPQWTIIILKVWSISEQLVMWDF